MRTVALTVLSLSAATLAGLSPLAAQRRSNVLTTEEIERAKVGTAYEAVQTLRPRWLQPVKELIRLPGTPDAPPESPKVSVYVNEVSVGDLEYLKDIPAATVLEMRWLKPFEAANRFGPTEGQAAIVVTLKPAR